MNHREEAVTMGWSGDTLKEKKFLVDLEYHTYISEKSHQEIIDQAGISPAGYDNYLKGWVKTDGTVKLWVETIEDLAFRYWDQIKLAFRVLVKEQLTRKEAKTYAIVNRVERFAGVVRDFIASRSRETFFDEKLGLAVQFMGQPRVEKNQPVILLVNYKLPRNRYLIAGTRGTVAAASSGSARKLKVRWKSTVSGLMKPRGGVELLTDRRLLTLV